MHLNLIHLTIVETFFIMLFLIYLLSNYAKNKYTEKLIREMITSLKSQKEDVIKKITVKKFKENILDEFVLEVNNSFEQMNAKVKNLQIFNANIAHELKSPLVLLKSELELRLLSTGEGVDPKIQNILEKLKLLEDIIEQMLIISNDKNIRQQMKRIFLNEVLHSAISQKKSLIQEKNIETHILIDDVLSIHANKLLIQYAIENIIDNAIKYTLRDGKIMISLVQKSKAYYICVKDNGVGIKHKELGMIFQPYVRGSQENNIIYGYGLGLSLSKWILSFHGASIRMRSQEGKGTLVLIKFKV